MKRIIEGFRYDTDKAHLVGEASANCPVNDFSYWEATLYKTPRAGRYFLAGSGGPMTRWSSRQKDGAISGSEGIIPLTEQDARTWAEDNLSAETVEHWFSWEEA